MAGFSIFPLGDGAVTLSLDSKTDAHNHQHLIRMKDWLFNNTFYGLRDVLVTYNSLTLFYDAFTVKNTNTGPGPCQLVKHLIEEAYHQTLAGSVEEAGDVIKIPVCYEPPYSPDLEFVSAYTKLNPASVIRIHHESIYRVFMIGYLPGFPYMGEVHANICVPRKSTPRARVEAGSVGLAGIQTGIYPLDSPGGWQIIGKTPIRMFDKNSNPPVKLEPGNVVQFYPINRAQFEELKFHA